MFPFILLALTFSAALVVAFVADRLGLLRHLWRARPLRAGALAFAVTFALITSTVLSPMLGCASSPQQRSARQQSLGAVLSRVDVARLLDCSRHGLTKATAKCLGAGVLTEGLEEAIHQATTLAEAAQEAGNPHAGAGDLDEGQEAVLAQDLDAALEHLALEIAAANTLADAQ